MSTFAVIETYNSSSTPVASKKPFYVGVTYCGDNVTEAEQLIDRVKNYTNLFVVQSGPLMDNGTALDQICDYAVNSGLNIIVYFANGVPTINVPSFLDSAYASWGSHFLGVYYDDEPGGKMLDSIVNLHIGNETVTKQQMGGPLMVMSGSNFTQFLPSGEIDVYTFSTKNEINLTVNTNSQTVYAADGNITYTSDISYMYANGTYVNSNAGPFIYEPNGTVLEENETFQVENSSGNVSPAPLIVPSNVSISEHITFQVVTNEGNISQFEPYQKLLSSRPLQTYTEAADALVDTEQQTLSSIGNQSDVNLFTSDYGLYWFDYLGGYNTVFAELFGEKTDAQTLALVRGAADMQNKSWGAMIEWANRTSISLQTGAQIYSEMRQAYEDGAGYAVVFNYSPNNNGTGLLQDEQFAAIQKFWTDVVENPKDTNNVRGQDVLVLPENYGWGMRNPNDTIWGLWPADNESQQVWNAVQSSLAKYGSRLDIVYSDPAYPTTGRYQHVYYWNQTI